MALKEPREKFTSLDHYRGKEVFSEYRNFWDNYDPKMKDEKLKEFICKKMPLNHNQRKNLFKAINTIVV